MIPGFSPPRRSIIAAAAADIEFIAGGNATATTITIPGTEQAGDLLLILSNRANNTPPSLPAGWTNVINSTVSHPVFGWSIRVGRKVAAGGSETSGTWTNASALVAATIRGVNTGSPIGTVGSLNQGGSSNISFPSVTLTAGHANRNHIVLAAAFDQAGLSTAPALTDFTNMSYAYYAGEIGVGLYISDAPLSSNFTGLTGSSYVAWIATAFEIRAV